MGNIIVERVPVVQLCDKYIDALIKNNSASLSFDLSIMVILLRHKDKEFTTKSLSELLHIPEIQIEVSLINLEEIGFFEPGYYIKRN